MIEYNKNKRYGLFYKKVYLESCKVLSFDSIKEVAELIFLNGEKHLIKTSETSLQIKSVTSVATS